MRKRKRKRERDIFVSLKISNTFLHMNSTGEIIDSTGGFYRGRLIGYDRMMENSFEYILSPLRLPGLFFFLAYFIYSASLAFVSLVGTNTSVNRKKKLRPKGGGCFKAYLFSRRC